MKEKQNFNISDLMRYIIVRSPRLIADTKKLELLAIDIYFTLEKEKNNYHIEDSFDIFRGCIKAKSASSSKNALAFYEMAKAWWSSTLDNTKYLDAKCDNHYSKHTNWNNPLFSYYQVSELQKINRYIHRFNEKDLEKSITNQEITKHTLDQFLESDKEYIQKLLDKSLNLAYPIPLPISRIIKNNSSNFKNKAI